MEEREYPRFNEGDEVYPIKDYSSLSKRHYIVFRCYTPPGFVKDYRGIVVDIMNDFGVVGRYASDKFKITDRQLRANKLKRILKNV